MAMQWVELAQIGLEGRGWSQTQTPYDRLPLYAKGRVHPGLWRLSQHTAGMSVRFRTDSSRLTMRWQSRHPLRDNPYMSRLSETGFDLYVHYRGQWELLGICGAMSQGGTQQDLIMDLPREPRRYLMHLPLYNGLKEAALGVDAEAFLEPELPRDPGDQPPIVFYGTSITQGAFASRSGMSYPAILGRRLDWPTINLGFAGMGKMEPAMASLLAELPARAFVLDPVPNLSGPEIRERGVPFIETIRHAHPETPLVVMESVERTIAHHQPAWRVRLTDAQKAIREVYDRLVQRGDSTMHYLTADAILGLDGETTVDGTHPSDLGFVQMADALTPILRQYCSTAPFSLSDQRAT